MPTTTLYQRIKQGVVDQIKGLNLPEIGGVYNQYDCDTLNSVYPKITCISAGLTEELLGGDTELRQYLWPVGVMIEDDPGAKVHYLEPKYLTWRKMISDAFHQRRLGTIQEAPGCIVLPRVIFDTRLSQYAAVRSSLLIKVEAWEQR
jgi:hypothetical protein